MPKGLITQALVVLLREPTTAAQLRARLGGFEVVAELAPSPSWELSGPAVTVAYRPDLAGLVAVDLVARPWPDDMGDPRASPTLFASWSMGHFGPFAYPRGLRRAVQQAWSWPEAAREVGEHRAFVRMKLAYALGADPDAGLPRPACDPRHELEFLTRLARALLRLPGAVCWFDPCGEVVLPAALVERRCAQAEARHVPALELWSNVRRFSLEAGWTLVDTVGNGQLDLPDLEAVFPAGGFEPARVEAFLRSVTWQLLEKGAGIASGDTVEGPGGLPWRAFAIDDGITYPPRRVLRCFPPGAEAEAPPSCRPVRGRPAAVAPRS